MVKSEPQNRRDAASVVTLVLLAPSSVPPGSGGSSQSEAAGRVSGKESGLKGLQMSLKTHSNERGYSANFNRGMSVYLQVKLDQIVEKTKKSAVHHRLYNPPTSLLFGW